MQLELKSRLCSNVHVVECKGRIVAGDEVGALEGVLVQDTRRHLTNVVLHIGEVDRLDSTGLGLLVRFVAKLRRRSGDLRLAAPAPFVTNLLELTKLASIVHTFPTEDEAILSFLRQQTSTAKKESPEGQVLVVDPSGDFCSFVRAVLTQHGFEVQSASVARDAGVLLHVYPAGYILVGPNIPQSMLESLAASMKVISPSAKVVQLDTEFKTRDAHEAAQILLQMVRPPSSSREGARHLTPG